MKMKGGDLVMVHLGGKLMRPVPVLYDRPCNSGLHLCWINVDGELKHLRFSEALVASPGVVSA
jgi:hypothetical protein